MHSVPIRGDPLDSSFSSSSVLKHRSLSPQKASTGAPSNGKNNLPLSPRVASPVVATKREPAASTSASSISSSSKNHLHNRSGNNSHQNTINSPNNSPKNNYLHHPQQPPPVHPFTYQNQQHQPQPRLTLERRIRLFNRNNRWFFPLIAILSCIVVSSWVTFSLPRYHLSDLPNFVIEYLDPNYLMFHDRSDLKPPSHHSTASTDDDPSSVLSSKCKIIFEKKRSKNSIDAEEDHQDVNNNNNNNVAINQDIFRTVIFSDLHTGEDGALDDLTMEFQQKVFEESKKQAKEENIENYFDLIVVLGDVASHSDYLPLRTSSNNKNEKSSSVSNRKVKQSLTSCLSPSSSSSSSSTLPVSNCWNMAHKNLFDQNIPIVPIFGNHDGPTPPESGLTLDNRNKNNKKSSASLASLSKKTDDQAPVVQQHTASLDRIAQDFLRSSSSSRERKNKDLLPCSTSSLSENNMCSLWFVSKRGKTIDDEEQFPTNDCFEFALTKLRHDIYQRQEGEQQIRDNSNNNEDADDTAAGTNRFKSLIISDTKKKKNSSSLTTHYHQTLDPRVKKALAIPLHRRLLSHSIDAHLMFFNSISDETDTLFLHGYKYASRSQIGQAKHMMDFLEDNQAENNDEKRDQRRKLLMMKKRKSQGDKKNKNSNKKDDKKKKRIKSSDVAGGDDAVKKFNPRRYRPLQIAFTHIPSSLYLKYHQQQPQKESSKKNEHDEEGQKFSSSLIRSSGSYNETAGCSPVSLDGTQRFADFVLTSSAIKKKLLTSSDQTHGSSKSYYFGLFSSSSNSRNNADNDDDEKLTEEEEEERSLSSSVAAKIDILISGHDHKNDYWQIHDREKLALNTPVLTAKRRAKLQKDRDNYLASLKSKSLSNSIAIKNRFIAPLHLAYARHSGFGGYFDLKGGSTLPGVRILEVSKVKLSRLKKQKYHNDKSRNSNNKADEDNFGKEEEFYCSQAADVFTDLKLCRLQEVEVLAADDDADEKEGKINNNKNDHGNHHQEEEEDEDGTIISSRKLLKTERFLTIVRSWIWEAELSKTENEQNNNNNNNNAADNLRKIKMQEEAALKKDEPEERLLHSELEGYYVSGIKKCGQELFSSSSSRQDHHVNNNNNDNNNARFGGDSSSSSSSEILETECSAVVDYRSYHTFFSICCWLFTCWVTVGLAYFESIVRRAMQMKAEETAKEHNKLV